MKDRVTIRCGRTEVPDAFDSGHRISVATLEVTHVAEFIRLTRCSTGGDAQQAFRGACHVQVGGMLNLS